MPEPFSTLSAASAPGADAPVPPLPLLVANDGSLAGATALRAALRELPGYTTTFVAARELSLEAWVTALRSHAVALLTRGCPPVPAAVAESPGRLRYLCFLTGELRRVVPRAWVEAGHLLTNWGDAVAPGVAEGTLALLLAAAHNLPAHLAARRAGDWSLRATSPTNTSLFGLRLGLFGCGAIGREFCRLVAPFRPELLVFDPYAPTLPEGAQRVASLDELCQQSEALLLFAGLTPETRHALEARRLALLPDHALVINTARGDLIDQAALFAELEKGRLRAALDVLAPPDTLPSDHPATTWPNLLLTAHHVGGGRWPPRLHDPAQLNCGERVALDNLARFARGEAPHHQLDLARYDRST